MARLSGLAAGSIWAAERERMMADEAENHTTSLLQETRAEIRDLRTEMQGTRTEMRQRFDAVDERFDGVANRVNGDKLILNMVNGLISQHDDRLDRLDRERG